MQCIELPGWSCVQRHCDGTLAAADRQLNSSAVEQCAQTCTGRPAFTLRQPQGCFCYASCGNFTRSNYWSGRAVSYSSTLIVEPTIVEPTNDTLVAILFAGELRLPDHPEDRAHRLAYINAWTVGATSLYVSVSEKEAADVRLLSRVTWADAVDVPAETPGGGVRGGALQFWRILRCWKVVSFQAKLEVGNLTYATWSDYFNIVLLCILILGLLESLFVHSLVLSNKTALAHMVDSRARQAISFGVFPVTILGMIVIGSSATPAGRSVGQAILAVGNVLVLVVLYLRVHRARKRRAKNQLAVAAALKTLKRGDEAYLDTLQMAFDLFDNDSSGEIDHKELRNALQEAGLEMDSAKAQELLEKYDTNQSGEMEFDEFVELSVALNRVALNVAGTLS